MGEKPTNTRDLGKWATNGLLAIALGGGTPYLASQAKEVQTTRETVIRLEEQNRNLLEQIKRIEQEQQHLRELLERFYQERKVAINLGPQPAGE